MAIISKNVFIVNCDRDKFESYFSRKRNSDIINHHEIRQRLTNNDIFKTPPSQDVVEFQIIKRLNSFCKCKKSEFLFFYVDNLESNLISNIKEQFIYCDFPVNYHLLIDQDLTPPKFAKEFDTIQKLEKDIN